MPPSDKAAQELPCPTHKMLDCNCDAARAQRVLINADMQATVVKVSGPYQCNEGCTRTDFHIHSSQGALAHNEAVNHPNHYGGDTTYETVKVLAAWGLGFLLGNAVKYISRAGKKDPEKLVEDLKKARWYLDEAIKRLERKEPLF